MKQHPFEEHLRRLASPAPDSAAKLRAKEAALAEFTRVHAADGKPAKTKRNAFKGFSAALRLTRADQQHGRAPMSWSTRNAVFGTAASVSVALLGLTLMWPIVLRQGGVPVGEVVLPLDSRAAKPQPLPATPNPEPQPINPVPIIELTADVPMPMEVPAPEPTPMLGPTSESMRRAHQATPTEFDAEELESVMVTGIRGSLQSSMDTKRDAIGVVDSISAEDIGRFPDSSIPHALNRIAGVSVDPENGDEFEHFDTNPVRLVTEAPVSTFSIDVDTASYSYMRAQLNQGVLPEKDAVRAEEMVNYFNYAWPAPRSAKEPFKPTVAVSDSPWGEGKKLVHIGIKGYEIRNSHTPDANLVFLLDVSGSMNAPDKLPLVKQSMRLLLSSLKPTDTVAIAVYAGAAGLALPPTEVKDKQKILSALDSLEAGGSTAGSEGIKLAYELAESHFRTGGVNRIVLATDGDFNVGITDEEELKGYVERQRDKGIFLSVLGFGQGNYHDEVAQALAQNGNGVAAYIDTLSEAQKVLVREANASLFTIAKDVKLQVEFNPSTVAEYRLIGYETRSLNREDFNNDAVDAGDIGSGHAVTAIYEITPADSSAQMIDKARYQRSERSRRTAQSKREYGYLKIRYKLPDSDRSELIEQPILIKTTRLASALRRDVQFSTAVAGFAQLLRGGTYTGSLTYEDVIEQATTAQRDDPHGYRAEFVDLVKKAQSAKGM